MVLPLLALLAAASSPEPVLAKQRARVSIMVLRPYRASAESWNPKLHANQREKLRKEADGSEVRLRLTEFE